MSDLTKVLPQDSETVRAIYAHWKQRGESEPARRYLGGSKSVKNASASFGTALRAVPSQTLTGVCIACLIAGTAEDTFVAELKGIGCEVHEVDPETGKQFQVVDVMGHFKGTLTALHSACRRRPKLGTCLK